MNVNNTTINTTDYTIKKFDKNCANDKHYSKLYDKKEKHDKIFCMTSR